MSFISQQLIFDQIPGCVAWKDIHLKFRAANKALLQQMNLKHQQDLIGLGEKELAVHSPQLIQIFHQQDLLVLSGQSLELIHQLDTPNDNKTYFLKKEPLRDEQSQIIGVIFHCMPYHQAELLNALKHIDNHCYGYTSVHDCYRLDTNHNPANLSVREIECLFLQLRGHSAKRIAETLNLSKRTVESYIDNIKTKLGCMNKSELLMTAMAHGYHRNIPKSLLNLNLLEILKR